MKTGTGAVGRTDVGTDVEPGAPLVPTVVGAAVVTTVVEPMLVDGTDPPVQALKISAAAVTNSDERCRIPIGGRLVIAPMTAWGRR
ncbi:MAG: hypothetical protein ACR2NL_01105 [Acidimicrobiia bacterium]